MKDVTENNALKGSFVNIEYALPNGQVVKFWDDDGIYFGNQLHQRTVTEVMELSPMKNISWYLNIEYSEYGSERPGHNRVSLATFQQRARL